MRGHLVERKGGWDCHGLPVEIAVEQQLGITSKAEIEERIGIERFNAECRESVFAFLEEWNRLTERIGFWIDLDDAYRTLDESYIESVWWALAQIHAARAALRGPQGRALLPALRDDAVLARGGARLPGRGRPERVPEAPAWRAARSGCSCGRRRRGRCPATWRWRSRRAPATRGRAWAMRRSCSPRTASRRCSARRRRSLERLHGRASWCERYRRLRGADLRRDRPRARRAADPRRRLRDDRGRHRHRAPGARLRRGRLPRGRRRAQVPFDATRAAHALQPGARRRHLRRARARAATGARSRGASSRTRS